MQLYSVYLEATASFILTCCEVDICLCLSLAVLVDGCQADIVDLSTLQLGQITLVLIRLTWKQVTVFSNGADEVGLCSFDWAPGHLGWVVVAVHSRCKAFSHARSCRMKWQRGIWAEIRKHDDLPVCSDFAMTQKILWYAMKNLFIVVERFRSKKLTNSAEFYEWKHL